MSPAIKPIAKRYRVLRIVQLHRRPEEIRFGQGGIPPDAPEPVDYRRVSLCESSQEVLCLFPELLDVRIRRKVIRHTTILSPLPACLHVRSEKTTCCHIGSRSRWAQPFPQARWTPLRPPFIVWVRGRGRKCLPRRADRNYRAAGQSTCRLISVRTATNFSSERVTSGCL